MPYTYPMKDCDCLCDTCLRARIINSLPDYVFEMSDTTRKLWIDRELKQLRDSLNSSVSS